MIDMNDDSSISASGLNIEIIYRGASLLEFTFKPNEEGTWNLEVDPEKEQMFSAEISASCTFNFLASFDYLDMNTTHPSLQTLPTHSFSFSGKHVRIHEYVLLHVSPTKKNDKLFVIWKMGR